MISASNSKVLESAEYSFSLKAGSYLAEPASASLIIVFPSEITVTDGACTLSNVVNFTAANCVVSSSTVTISDFSANTLD